MQLRSLILTCLTVFTITGRSSSNSCPDNAVFTAGPMNMTLNVGDSDIVLTCDVLASLRSVTIWEHLLNGEIIDIIASNFGNKEIYDFSDGNLLIPTVFARHHGEYRCRLQSPCNDRISASGYLEVTSPTLIEFVEDGIPSRTVDDNLTIPLRMFGSPTPTLTLYKLATSSKRAIEGYEVVTDPRIIVSTTGITFNFLQFTDEGSYLLIAETVQGNSNITFAVNVTGVEEPIVTLSNAVFAPRSYGEQLEVSIICSVPKNAFDADEGGLTLQWRHQPSMEAVAISSTENIYQTELTKTTVSLNIQSISESDNGLYLCFAQNNHDTNPQSNSSLAIRGPPASVTELKALTLGSTTAIITWKSAESYGAALENYMIRYTRDGVEPVLQSENGDAEQHDVLTDICPSGEWDVSVWAVNEYGGIGSASTISITISNGNCITGSSSPDVSISSTTTQGRTRSDTTSTSTPGTRPVTSSIAVEPTIGSVSSTSIPIAAGAAAGAFILIILVAVLIFAIACYVTVNKRGPRGGAEQQWSHGHSMDTRNHVDNGYVERNMLMQAKSPDPPINGYEMGLPSPLPASPGYGPIYVDPRYEFPRENLEFTDILYDGTFTVIYKAKAVGINEGKPTDVAVKSLKEEFLDFDDYSSSLIMEMEQLAQLEPHKNIVGLVRVCSVSRPVLMVMEYMCHGDLLGFLRTTRGHTDMYTVYPGTKNLPTHLKLTSRDLLSIIKQVATGMKFLSEQKIVHGALCARNVLVTTSMEVKINNIGIHNLDNDETALESLVRWMAPEVFVDGVRTSYGDVWSFGVLMWEVVTLGGTPYADSDTSELYTHLMSGVRLQKPPHCAQPVYDIMTTCWETIPQHRPLFFEINEHLQNLNLSKMSYLDLRNYNETAYSQFDEPERQLPETSIL